MQDADARLLARPLYLQVRDVLVHRIVDGDWKPGATLPNEGLLARQFGISVGTVRKALDMMENERIVTRRQGRGTFVNDCSDKPSALSNFVDREGSKFLDEKRAKFVRSMCADTHDAQRLGIETGAPIIRVERIRYHAGQPYMTEVCRLSARMFPRLPADLSDYRLSVLAQRNSILVGQADESISATVATASDAADLAVEEGAALLELDRVILSDLGDALEWRVARCKLRNEHFIVRHR